MSQNDGNGGTGTVATVLQQIAGATQTLRDEHQRLVQQRNTIDEQIEQVANGLAQLGAPLVERARRAGRPRGSRNVAGRRAQSGRRPLATRRAASAGRVSNDQNLPTAIATFLTENGPSGVPDIMAGVQKAPINYQTNADDFRSIVQQVFTNHLVNFGRDGNPKTDKEGNPLGKGGRAGMFVRLSRGVYDNFRKGDTAEKIAKRGAKAEAAAEAAPAAA